MKPVLLIHGGAWAIPGGELEPHRVGVEKVLASGYAVLAKDGSALDAVEHAVTLFENDPAFNAGTGGVLTSEGRVQMDALIMDGARMLAGGVACVEHLKNPIQAARLVLEQSRHCYFVGQGAEAFAHEHGMPLIDNAELVTERERARLREAQEREKAGLPDNSFTNDMPPQFRDPRIARGYIPDPLDSHDTVGAVAMDAEGRLATATSTGGTPNKVPGRVGDSSLIGCGGYADNQSAAVSLTGWGEPIMKLVLAKWAADRVEAGSAPQDAAQAAIRHLAERLGGYGGLILVGPDGRWGIAHNTPHMAWGVCDAGGPRIGTEFPG